MLRIIQNSSSGGAKSYYTEGLAREDGLSREGYYSEGQESAGHWGGKGAERLGLGGLVTKEAFDALCENRHPVTGEHLTARTKDNRTVGYDLNFHCPKSLSLLYAMTEDPAIMTAFRSAVRDTMDELEAEIKTRVRKGGENSERTTGNLVYGVGNGLEAHHCFGRLSVRPKPAGFGKVARARMLEAREFGRTVGRRDRPRGSMG